jgi:alpha-mannosidase
MGTAPVNDAPFSRDHSVEVDLANSLLHVDQLLQLPPAAAASEASSVVAAGRLVLGKWVPVAPNVAHDIIIRSAALQTGQFKSVNL